MSVRINRFLEKLKPQAKKLKPKAKSQRCRPKSYVCVDPLQGFNVSQQRRSKRTLQGINQRTIKQESREGEKVARI